MTDAPRPASGHMPFAGHRTLAEAYAPCTACDQVRSHPCGYGLCPKLTAGVGGGASRG